MAHLNPFRFFRDLDVQHVLFPWLRYRHAARLMQAIGRTPPRHHYIHCDLGCESGAPVLPPPPAVTPGWVNAAPPHHQLIVNAAGAQVFTPCHNRPVFPTRPRRMKIIRLVATSQASVWNHNISQPPACIDRHIRKVKGQFADLVSREGKMTLLKFGVCFACRNWALANMAPGQDDCLCEPVGRYVGGINNNEHRYENLCQFHEAAYWNNIEPVADNEIDIRRTMLRIRRAKKRGHNWSRKKGRQPVRIPDERRLATRWQGAALPLQATPRCYCGDELVNMEHGRGDFFGQVRNCVGCNRFQRLW